VLVSIVNGKRCKSEEDADPQSLYWVGIIQLAEHDADLYLTYFIILAVDEFTLEAQWEEAFFYATSYPRKLFAQPSDALDWKGVIISVLLTSLFLVLGSQNCDKRQWFQATPCPIALEKQYMGPCICVPLIQPQFFMCICSLSLRTCNKPVDVSY
jgi:hypothetical protein